MCQDIDTRSLYIIIVKDPARQKVNVKVRINVLKCVVDNLHNKSEDPLS